VLYAFDIVDTEDDFIQVETPTITPEEGYHQKEIYINIKSKTKDATIYYTTDFTKPDSTSKKFDKIITMPLNSTMVINAIAIKKGYKDSEVKKAIYVTTGRVQRPEFAEIGGMFVDYAEISFKRHRSGATIRYSIDGSDVDANSSLYTKPFKIKNNTTIKARAFKENWSPSNQISQTYAIVNIPQIQKIIINRDSLSVYWQAPNKFDYFDIFDYYYEALEFEVSYKLYLASLENENYEFVEVSQAPITDNKYEMVIPVSGKYAIKIEALYNEKNEDKKYLNHTSLFDNTSDIIEFEIFKVDEINSSHFSGTYYEPIDIELEHENADIYYTVDGSDPNEKSIKYTELIHINNNQEVILKFRGFYENHLPSNIKVLNLKVTDIVKRPDVSVKPGVYNQPFYVEMNSITPNSIIYYTTNGATPDSSSKIYNQPIIVDETMTIMAYAKKSEHKDSEIIKVTYKIESIENIEIEQEIVFNTRLINIEPNPFNNQTNISFSLEKEDLVELDIYNILGQKIALLLNEKREKGLHSIIWNAIDFNNNKVAEGVYFCHFRTTDYYEMIKLVVKNTNL
jgi:hypothetical protein